MKKNLLYLRYIAIHKWYVLVECIKYGLYWRGMVHDLSKLLPSEFVAYREYFYGDLAKEYRQACVDPFDYAWNRHQKRNKHHWQYWLLKQDNGGLRPLEIPLVYRMEMVADWRGAGKAVNGKDDVLKWYTANRLKMIIAPRTREWIELEIGYKCEQ